MIYLVSWVEEGCRYCSAVAKADSPEAAIAAAKAVRTAEAGEQVFEEIKAEFLDLSKGAEMVSVHTEIDYY